MVRASFILRVAAKAVRQIVDLDESVADPTEAVVYVKRLGVKLVKAMKARDREVSLAILEKIDLQIKQYTSLRESTGEHNHLILQRFHTLQKQLHSLFDELAALVKEKYSHVRIETFYLD